MGITENNRNEYGTILDGISPKCGAILAGVVAEILSEGLDNTEIATLGSFLASVGDLMGYIATQKELNENLKLRREQANKTQRQKQIFYSY